MFISFELPREHIYCGSEISTTLDGFLLHVENDHGTVVCLWSFHCFERVECGDWVELV